MAGKVCVVTGATSGLGAATALALAEQGATVVLVGRSRSRSEAMVEQIERRTGARAEGLLADLSSQSSIRDLAVALQERYPRVDVLINNAGGVFFRRRTTADGLEMTFALNHLGYFLLTGLLIDRLKASAPARIVNVSSVSHYGVELDFADLQHRRGYRPYRVYARSKLANLLFTYELARRLEGTGVTANAADPGLVATRIGSNNGWIGRLATTLLHLRYRSNSVDPAEGARTAVYLASSPEVAGISGRYFTNGAAVPSSPGSSDPVAARRLWEISDELCGYPFRRSEPGERSWGGACCAVVELRCRRPPRT